MSDTDKAEDQSENPQSLDLSGDDAAYVRWARDIGFDQVVQTPNLEPENDDEYVPAVRAQIDDWFDEVYVPVIDALWNKYVPKSGACTVLQGEMSRCIGRLEGEYFKNGMMNMGDRAAAKSHSPYFNSFAPAVLDAFASKVQNGRARSF